MILRCSVLIQTLFHFDTDFRLIKEAFGFIKQPEPGNLNFKKTL